MQVQFELPEGLKTDIEFIKSELQSLKENFQPKKEKIYLTRKETANLLKVDLSTLWNWQQKHILIPKGIGKRVLYLREDVENKLVDLK